ncbi:hypothetical protein HFV04_026960 [Pseudomonas sp. BIGb0427]|uniref:T6SS immunity protein Tli4 family protein n=1 Tax=unclassified Pseudomonas TaxID=196821 RepID=UPI0018A77FEC|nr:T6SS immunity protein Tli4 family protein [Pseudomonas sp. BIGb0427]QPG63090.1 hypothetical protein HFV04_026960 [Pseudomonas sp. BIGb0427]
MRVFVLFAGLCHSLLALADVAPADYQTPPGWRTECMGRVQFDVPKDIAWHTSSGYWQYYNFELPDPTITPGEQQIAYGDGLTPKQRYLVDIEVSPLTTRELFEQIRYSQTLNVEPAQQRVVKAEIKALDAVISATRSDDSGYRALLDQSIELDEKLERIGYVHSQLILLDDLIRQFTAEGRSVAKAQAERDAFFKEQAQWPTDVEFEHERSIELGLPDAFANWYEGKLVAYLWRNQRIYRFNFHSGATTATASAALALLEPRARAVLAAFRTRKQYETPQENGFCVPYGFIADDGAPRHAITLGFTPADNPKLLHRLSMSNDDEKAVDMVPMLLDRLIANPFPLQISVDKFGPSSVRIGAAKGRFGGARFRVYEPDSLKPAATETFRLVAGALGSGYQPTVVLGVTDEHSEPPLQFEPSRDDFLRTLQSVRALPGGHRFAVQDD